MLNDAPAASGQPVDDRFSRPRKLAFGIGAQKSATTWLAAYLSGHPEFHMSPRKELHFWSVVRGTHYRQTKLKNDTDRARAARDATWLGMLRSRLRALAGMDRSKRHAVYARLYDQPAAPYANYADALFFDYKGEPVAGEFTPAYATLSPESFREMASLAKDVRFLFVMRDPVARLVSGVRHVLRDEIGSKNVTPELVRERIVECLALAEDFDLVRSRYDRTISRLESAVGTDKVFYLFYETMFRQTEMDRLCDFLEITHAPARVDQRVNGGRDSATAVDDDLWSAIRTNLAPVYDFVRQRFGSLPVAWERKLEG